MAAGMDAVPEVVSVNGVVIAEAAIAAEMQHHPAPSRAAAWNAAARALAVRELLLQEARRLGLDAAGGSGAGGPVGAALDSDGQGRRLTGEDALIARLLAAEVAVPVADEAACRRYYDNNRARFRSPDVFEAAHILLAAVPPPDPPADGAAAGAADRAAGHDEAMRLAAALIARLKDHPQEFAALARAHSACPSAAVGGSLGQVTRGQTVPELETFLFALEPGQLCPVPVKTRYGAHVLRLDRRIEGRPLPFEAVHQAIAGYLEEAVWRRATAQYVRILAGRAQWRGIALDGADTPLVQ
ncbi:MAG: peptidylprolyl isomerase [Thalassobaculales bacterium]